MTTESPLTTDHERVFEAIADEDCREILETTATRPRTVSDLVDHCEIPVSTAYRKVKTLLDIGLLDSSIRVQTAGRDATEYSLCVEGLYIDLTSVNAYDARTLSDAEDERTEISDSNEGESEQAVPDGGTSTSNRASTGNNQQDQLGTIFVDVTGTDTLVEEQESMPSSRCVEIVGKDTPKTLPEYVTTMARADGLSGVLDGAGYAPD